jgi:hypothetical protein
LNGLGFSSLPIPKIAATMLRLRKSGYHSVSSFEEVADTVVNVVVDGSIGGDSCAKTEVRRPAAEQAIESLTYSWPRVFVAAHEKIANTNPR